MPGLFGFINPASPDAARETRDRMARGLIHQREYLTGTFEAPELGLYGGWTAHPETAAGRGLVWNDDRSVGWLPVGEWVLTEAALDLLRSHGRGSRSDDAGDLVWLYEKLGLDSLRQMNGWFGGLILDRRAGQVVLCNDRFAFSRIYWHENRDGFYFASEAKALLQVLPETRQFDPIGLGEVLSCGCALRNRTLFKGVSLLPAASAWTFRPGAPAARESYFKVQEWEDQPRLGASEYLEKLRATYGRVLPRYLRGPRPVGMSLTGGLDGRMIMAWAGRTGAKLPCYTFGGIYRDSVDVKLARRVAALCGQEHQVIPVARQFLSEFPTLAEQTVVYSDGAMDVTGAAEIYVNRAARAIAPVRLTGNYGSEILRGVVAFKPDSSLGGILEPELRPPLEAAAEVYTAERRCHPLSFIAFKQVPWHHYSRLSVEQSQMTMRSPFLDNELVALVYQAPDELAASREPCFRLIEAGHPALNRIETDRGLRSPPIPVLGTLRHLWQEFTFRAEYAYDYGMPQSVVRVDHALRGLHLERLFLGRHKFNHFRVWYRDEWGAYLRDMLLGPAVRCQRYFRPGAVREVVESHLAGVRNCTTAIHRMLTLEIIERRLLHGL